MKLSFRTWVSVGTVVLVAAILYLARHELIRAWELMSQVNLWILSLVVPLLLFSYYASGETVFSYLRQKGNLGRMSIFSQIRLALELNFVNHVMPSGGASGLTYMALRLKAYGVVASKATMAQVVRVAVGFAAFIVLLMIAVLIITIDGNINRSIILVSSSLVGLMVGVSVIGGYFLWRKSRVSIGARWLTKTVNVVVKRVSFGRITALLDGQRVQAFMVEMHDDLVELRRDKKVLRKPFIWSLLFTATEVAVFFVVFWSLGQVVNPAPILIAYGLATVAGFVVATPGGSGAYEALMVGFLAIAGLSQGVALAGVVLARVIILVVILVVGYVFYQQAVSKYGIKVHESNS